MKKVLLSLVFVLFASVFIYASPPTATGSNLSFNGIDGKTFSGSFTAGNGTTRLIVMREGSPVTGMPVNGVQYAANSNFGAAGSQFTVPGEFVVQASSWASFSASNLKPNTIYYVAVFEYNGSGSNTEYLMLPLTGSRMTATTPTVQASAVTSANVIGNSLTLSWTKGNGSGRIVLARKASAVDGVPTDLTFYYDDENFGSGTKIGTDNFVVYRGAGSSVQVKNLEPNTTYHFAIFEYNGSNSPVYLNPSVITSVVTNQGPTVASTSIGFNWVEGNSFTIVASGGNGSKHLFVARKGAPVTAVPVNGANYTASAVFGAGQELAPGEFIIANGSGGSVALTNLEAGTKYYFRIYEFDTDKAGNTYYLTSSYGSKEGSTQPVPTVLASNINLVSLSGSSAKIGLTNGNGTYRTAIMREGSPVDAAPVNLTTYGSNANFGTGPQLGTGNYVITWGMNGSPFTVNNLKAGKTYHLSVFEFNGNGAPVYSTSAATFSFSIPLEPSLASKNPLVHFTDGAALRLVWTNGNGSNRLVIAKKSSAPSFKPVDGVSYMAKAAFGTGASPAADEYVVYNGTDNYVDITNLQIASTYHFAVYEFNLDENGSPDYLTTAWMGATATTVSYPTVQTTLSAASNIQATAATINFTKGNGESRLFIMKEGSVPDSIPADYRKYSNNTYGSSASHIGNGNYVVNKTSGNTNFGVSNMKPKTTYYISAYEFNGSNYPAYLTTPAATISFTTADIPGATTPTTAASNAVVSDVDGNKFTFKWTNGNGEKRIVIMRKNGPVDFVPASATGYPANAAFGSGTDLGGGQYVVYSSNGNTVDITNLEVSTTYYFAIYEFNGSGDLLRYIASPATASGSTSTTPTTLVTNVNTITGTTDLTINWTAGNGAGRLVVLKEGSPVTTAPVNLSVYPANAVFKNGSQMAAGEYVVFAGAGNSVKVTGLKNATYYYSIFEFNGNTAPVYSATPVSGSAVISSTLPVQLVSFTAKELKGQVELKWATRQELNSLHFVVERSLDGVHYTTVEIVPAAGTSTNRKEYSYTDKETLHVDKAYYRLKMVDRDNAITYSPVATVQLKGGQEKVEVYPNPVTSQFSVRLPKGVTIAQLSLYDGKGLLLSSQQISNGRMIDASKLAAGVYYVVIESNGRKYTASLLKQ